MMGAWEKKWVKTGTLRTSYSHQAVRTNIGGFFTPRHTSVFTPLIPPKSCLLNIIFKAFLFCRPNISPFLYVLLSSVGGQALSNLTENVTIPSLNFSVFFCLTYLIFSIIGLFHFRRNVFLPSFQKFAKMFFFYFAYWLKMIVCYLFFVILYSICLHYFKIVIWQVGLYW